MKRKPLFQLGQIAATITFIILASYSFAQQQEHFYFDLDNTSVSKGKFERKADYRHFIDVEFVRNDSIIHQYVPREEKGKIMEEDLVLLRKYLKKCIDKDIPYDEILVIKYYPGKDACSSSGLGYSDKQLIRLNYQELKSGIYHLGGTTLVHLYKDDEGLEKQKGIVPWHHDMDGGIEELFFKYHYPCGSFAVINTSGEYYAYFGESAYVHIFDKVKEFQHKNGINK